MGDLSPNREKNNVSINNPRVIICHLDIEGYGEFSDMEEHNCIDSNYWGST